MDENEELIGYLMSQDAIYIDGIDKNNEPIYRFNMNVLKAVMPELYETVLEELDNDLIELYKMGLVDISYDEDLNANFKVSEKGKIYMQTGIMPEDEVE